MDTTTSEQRSVLSYPPSQCDTSLTGRDSLHDLAVLTGSDVEKSQIISMARNSTAEQSLPMTGTPTSHSKSETWWFPRSPALPLAHRPKLLTQLLFLPLRARSTRKAALCRTQNRQALVHPHPPQARGMTRYVRIYICLQTTQNHTHKVKSRCGSTPATHPCRCSDADATTIYTE